MHVKSIHTFISENFREDVTHTVLFAGFLDFFKVEGVTVTKYCFSFFRATSYNQQQIMHSPIKTIRLWVANLLPVDVHKIPRRTVRK